jgi:hypothetical protein
MCTGTHHQAVSCHRAEEEGEGEEAGECLQVHRYATRQQSDGTGTQAEEVEEDGEEEEDVNVYRHTISKQSG